MGRARTAIWRSSVLALFALCFALPLAALREHGPGAALLALGVTFALWHAAARRPESLMALGLFSLLCLLLPVLASAFAVAAMGLWGALFVVVVALFALVFHISQVQLRLCQLLPIGLVMMVAAGNVGLALANLAALVRALS